MKTTLTMIGLSLATVFASCRSIKGTRAFVELLNVKPYTVTHPPSNYEISSQQPGIDKHVVTVHYKPKNSKNHLASYKEVFYNYDENKTLDPHERVGAQLTLEDKKGHRVTYIQKPGEFDGNKLQSFIETRKGTTSKPDTMKVASYPLTAQDMLQLADFTAARAQAKSMLNMHFSPKHR